MKKVKILNVQFDVCTKDEALARILDVLARPYECTRHIVTPNPEMLLAAARSPEFTTILNRAWMSIPDGIGILWAATLQKRARKNSGFLRGTKAVASLFALILFPSFCRKIFPERVSGVDLMESACAACLPTGKASGKLGTRIFLLGAGPGIAEKTQKFLETKYPGVHIVGVFSGSPDEDDFVAIRAMIAETQPDILFAAFGAPAQEEWIARHLRELKPVKIAMGVGGAFDFLSGAKKRAPKWMQKIGLEWLYRVIQEPSRIGRIWNAMVKFPLKIISRK